MANSLKSPKNPFRVEIHYKKAQKNVGSVVSYTAETTEACAALAEWQANGKEARVIIKQNLEEYPQFNWQTVASYTINK